MIFNAIVIGEDNLNTNQLVLRLKGCIPRINLVGEAYGIMEGVELLRKKNAQIAFCNIDILGDTEISILEHLTYRDFHLIFTTKSNHFGIELFKKYDLKYITKPFSVADILITINALNKGFVQKTLQSKNFDLFYQEYKRAEKNKIDLPSVNGDATILPDNIIRVESKGNLSTIYMGDKSWLIIKKRFDEINKILNSNDFCTLDKTNMVNLNNLNENGFLDGNQLRMKDGYSLKLSRRKKHELMKKMATLLN